MSQSNFHILIEPQKHKRNWHLNFIFIISQNFTSTYNLFLFYSFWLANFRRWIIFYYNLRFTYPVLLNICGYFLITSKQQTLSHSSFRAFFPISWIILWLNLVNQCVIFWDYESTSVELWVLITIFISVSVQFCLFCCRFLFINKDIRLILIKIIIIFKVLATADRYEATKPHCSIKNSQLIANYHKKSLSHPQNLPRHAINTYHHNINVVTTKIILFTTKNCLLCTSKFHTSPLCHVHIYWDVYKY